MKNKRTLLAIFAAMLVIWMLNRCSYAPIGEKAVRDPKRFMFTNHWVCEQREKEFVLLPKELPPSATDYLYKYEQGVFWGPTYAIYLKETDRFSVDEWLHSNENATDLVNLEGDGITIISTTKGIENLKCYYDDHIYDGLPLPVEFIRISDYGETEYLEVYLWDGLRCISEIEPLLSEVYVLVLQKTKDN